MPEPDAIDRELQRIDRGEAQSEGTMREVRPTFQRTVPRPDAGPSIVERLSSALKFRRPTTRDERDSSRR